MKLMYNGIDNNSNFFICLQLLYVRKKNRIKSNGNVIDKLVKQSKIWKSIPLEPKILQIFAHQVTFYLSFDYFIVMYVRR